MQICVGTMYVHYSYVDIYNWSANEHNPSPKTNPLNTNCKHIRLFLLCIEAGPSECDGYECIRCTRHAICPCPMRNIKINEFQ